MSSFFHSFSFPPCLRFSSPISALLFFQTLFFLSWFKVPPPPFLFQTHLTYLLLLCYLSNHYSYLLSPHRTMLKTPFPISSMSPFSNSSLYFSPLFLFNHPLFFPHILPFITSLFYFPPHPLIFLIFVPPTIMTISSFPHPLLCFSSSAFK
jgi:hypothetical protein